MRSLRIGAAAALSLSAIPACAQVAAGCIANTAHADERSTAYSYAEDVADAARRFGIPETWIWQVMHVESGGNSRAVSRAGAMGLMQLMPLTWAALRTQLGLGDDPFDARNNIVAGAAYLRALHDRYGDRAAMLAAYNAGPSRYDDYLSRGRPLPAETQAYIAKLAPAIGTARDVLLTSTVSTSALAWRSGGLFIRAASVAQSTHSNTAYSAGKQLIAAGSAAERPVEHAPFDVQVASKSVRPSQSDSLFVRRSAAGQPR